MYSLIDIQKNIHNAIFDKNTILPFIKDNGNISSTDRLMVHLDTIFENFITMLQVSYPGVWKLLGDDCARGIALAYSHDYNNLISSSEFNDFGQNFPKFLLKFPSTINIPYLSSYAQLEWLRSKSYDSVKESSVNLDQMQRYFNDNIEKSYLSFNSSVFFLRSDFCLIDIEEFLNSTSSKSLSLKKEDTYLIICKVSQEIETISLKKEQWYFLKNINDGKNIGDSSRVFDDKLISSELESIVYLMLNKEMIVNIYD